MATIGDRSPSDWTWYVGTNTATSSTNPTHVTVTTSAPPMTTGIYSQQLADAMEKLGLESKRVAVDDLDRDINTIAVDLDDVIQAIRTVIANLDEATGTANNDLNDAEYFLDAAKEALDKARKVESK